jgi:glycosyltransferase involved in cell wall biosynthesis
MSKDIRVALVTNFIQHYRARFFEMLAARFDMDYYFFSEGDEHYWLPQHGSRPSAIRAIRLKKFKLGNTYILPGLLGQLVRRKYDVYLSGIVGRFTMPITFLAAKINKRPFILWTGVWNRIGTLGHRVFFPITRYLYRHADALVVYGRHVKSFLISEGVNPERIFIGQNAIDNAAYMTESDAVEIDRIKARFNIGSQEKIIIYIGRFTSEKGLDLLLRAFAKIKREKVKLLLAGAGPELSHLQQLSRELNIEEQTVFGDYVPPEKVASLYATAWCSVLPSITTYQYKETWGLVVNEAFAQGVPVIASDCVGAAADGFLEDEVTGLIFPEGNVDALAERLVRLLTEPRLRDQLGKEAKKRLLENGLDNMLNGFVRAIEFVTENQPTKDQIND